MTRALLLDRLTRGPPLLLDGPTGTELERRGADTVGPLWSTRVVRERPGLVGAVHRDYVDAGADILTAVTFRGHLPAFQEAGLDEEVWRVTNRDALRLARDAARHADRPCWVAGSLAPVADCYTPDAVPDDATLQRAHTRQAAIIADAGADLVLVETMNTVREAVAATRAAKATGLPVFVSFIVDEGARLLSGERLDTALSAVRSWVDASLVNCTSLSAVADAVPVLQGAGRPWGAYANGASRVPRPGDLPGDEVGIEAYVEAALGWRDAGARVVGSCCGTGPAHTRRLRERLAAAPVGTDSP